MCRCTANLPRWRHDPITRPSEHSAPSDHGRQLVHFGMKAHAGMDADSGVVRTVMGTLTNVGDVTQACALVS